MTIGERIKYFRENEGMTQSALAEKISTTKQTIYKYENNIITNIPSDKLDKISDVLRVSPVILMGWDSEFNYIEREIHKAKARDILHDPDSSFDERYNAKLDEYLCLYARSLHHAELADYIGHPNFHLYVAKLLNQDYEKKRMDKDIYNRLVENFGTATGITSGTYWYPPENHYEPQTIAAHHDNDEWTQDELDEIEQFKAYVRSKRK